MKAISLWQPWATAVAAQLKRIETRHWWTSHRGLLAIHAAKKWNRELAEMAEPYAHVLPSPLPFGAIVAVARLVSVFSTNRPPHLTLGERQWGNYGPDRYGWVFEDIRALPEPIPFKGAQGFFEVPDSLFPEAHRRICAAPALLL